MPTAYNAKTSSGYHVPLQHFEANSSDQPPILLLPALGMAARFYQPIAKALSKAGLDCWLFEQRGHGESTLRAGRHSDWGFKEWLSEDLPAAIALIQSQHKAQTITLLGHSLGGHIGCEYAALHPEQINALILSGCGTPWLKTFKGKQNLQLRLLNHLLGPTVKLLGYYPGKQLGFGGTEAKTLMLDWQQLCLHNHYQATGLADTIEKQMTQLEKPLLCLRYSQDDFAPKAAIEAVLAKLPNTQLSLRELDAKQLGHPADHFTWARQPQAVVSIIIDWLKSL